MIHDSPAPPSDKAALRRALRARRRAFVAGLDPASRNLALEALAARVLPHLGDARTVAGYVANAGEVDPLPILVAAHAEGRRIALPSFTDRDAPLRFRAWAPEDALEAGPFGLMQPPADAAALSPDLILAPLVGFDRALRRLGQGGGHYDRAFAGLPAARRIGLAWACQEEAHIPDEPWDIPLDAIATEREWIGRDG